MQQRVGPRALQRTATGANCSPRNSSSEAHFAQIDLMHLAGLPGTLNQELLQSIILLDLPGTQIKELLQSILLIEVACWIQTLDCKNLGPLLSLASKHTMTEHRMYE